MTTPLMLTSFIGVPNTTGSASFVPAVSTSTYLLTIPNTAFGHTDIIYVNSANAFDMPIAIDNFHKQPKLSWQCLSRPFSDIFQSCFAQDAGFVDLSFLRGLLNSLITFCSRDLSPKKEAVNLKVTKVMKYETDDYVYLDNMSYGVMATNAIIVSRDIGLIELLDKETLTLDKIQARTGIHERPITVLLETLIVAGIIEQDRGRYHLSKIGKFYLAPSSEESIQVWKFLDELTDKWPAFVASSDETAFDYFAGHLEFASQLIDSVINGAEDCNFNMTVYGILPSAILIFGVKSGLFDALVKGNSTIEDISAKVGVPVKRVKNLLNYYQKIGLIKRIGETYSLTDISAKFLVSSSEFDHTGSAGLIGSPTNLTKASDLKMAVFKDAPIISETGNVWEDHRTDEEKAADFTRFMQGESWFTGIELARKIDFTNYNSVLDVAGGSGAIAIAILRQNAHMKAIVTDLPTVIPMVVKYAEKAGVADRLKAVVSDMFTESLPKGADVILFGQIIHDYDTAKNLELLKKAYDSMPNGGKVIVHERLIAAENESQTPLANVLQSLFMLIWTEGRQYKGYEIEKMLKDAGFREIETIPTAGGYSAVTGIKMSDNKYLEKLLVEAKDRKPGSIEKIMTLANESPNTFTSAHFNAINQFAGYQMLSDFLYKVPHIFTVKFVDDTIRATARNLDAVDLLEQLARQRPDLFEERHILLIAEYAQIGHHKSDVLNELANKRLEIFQPEHLEELLRTAITGNDAIGALTVLITEKPLSFWQTALRTMDRETFGSLSIRLIKEGDKDLLDQLVHMVACLLIPDETSESP